MSLRRELLAAAVPSMGADDLRVALGPPYKTATGQWAVEVDGTALWHGTGTPTPKPDRALLDKVAAVRAAYVPEPESTPPPDVLLLLKAMERRHRGEMLTAEERAALNALVQESRS